MTNILEFAHFKAEGRKISMVTAYDAWSARLVARSQVDAVLVGDSAAMVMHGHPTTLPASVQLMAVHTRAVATSVGEKFLIADLPFLSYRKGIPAAMTAVGTLMESGAQAVKLEGVDGHEDVIRQIVGSGVPVMGHIGLTPQSVNRLGGFRVQGRNDADAADLIRQAHALEELGCFSIVLECVPAALAADITSQLQLPTIGIGAGVGTGRAGPRATRPLGRGHETLPAIRASVRRWRRPPDGRARSVRRRCQEGPVSSARGELLVVTVFEAPSWWRSERRGHIRTGQTLGLVPTMGALHEGHLSLVRRSQAENDLTLVSIFVNPAQFDEQDDLALYPRFLEADLETLRAEGTDFVWVPREEDLYPDGYRYRVTETERSTELEGASRPGHFDGVLTVVFKLLQIASAEHAYFGEKDWQQLTLVRGMVEAFFLPTTIVACVTVREKDGLAVSSRNRRLSPEERARASGFYRVLSAAPTAEAATRDLQASGFAVDYVEDRDGRRLGAVRLGEVRLIDNVPLEAAS